MAKICEKMKNILAVVVNYGTEQLGYLRQVVDALKAIDKFRITVVVNSNLPLDDIPGIDRVNVIDRYDNWLDVTSVPFRLGLHTWWNGKLHDYNLLPMTCRKVIDDESGNFDYFIYTENDHLWLEHHIEKFIGYESVLPENRIAGLIQYEQDENGKYFPAYHGQYDWDYHSVEEYGGKIFAHFTNLHQASFMISRNQLARIREQYDFTNFFSNDRYRIKCKVNTDIYQYCGMKKVICVSEFEDNLIHHLPNIYIGGTLGRDKLGSNANRMYHALRTMLPDKKQVLVKEPASRVGVREVY